MSDSFPNAEKLFRDAFFLPDPAPMLLELIKAHPTYAAVMDLLEHYTAFVQEHPSRANTLALALVAVRDSSDAPLINGHTLFDLFYRELADLLSLGFYSTDNSHNDNENFVPTNTFLLTSLLSGLSIKYNLTDSSDQYGNIWESLNVKHEWSTSEVRVIGACIQLLTSGSIIIQNSKPYIQSAMEATTKLKAQRFKRTVKDPNALRLLEACQSLMKYKI